MSPAVADHSLSSMTLNPSISANSVAYDFCAPRVGRYVKRKLRPESTDPSLLSPTSAIPCPSSEGGSVTIAKGRVSIFMFPRFLGFGRIIALHRPPRIYANFVAKNPPAHVGGKARTLAFGAEAMLSLGNIGLAFGPGTPQACSDGD
jgi:hypothetical protein